MSAPSACFRPVGDKILVRVPESDGRTPGGLHIPQNARRIPQRGTVVAIGSGRTLKNGTKAPLDVQPDDEILFIRWAGQDVRLGYETDLQVMREDSVTAILRDGKWCPLYDRMLVKPVYEHRHGLLYIPDSAHGDLGRAYDARPQRGIVKAIGRGEYWPSGKLKPVAVSVGQEVAFRKNAGDPVEIDGEELLVMCEGDVTLA
jgi:chaperonin GroES